MKTLSGRSCIFSALFVVLFFLPIIGQDKNWRPVPPEDIASDVPVVEPGADAEALLWEMRIDDSSDDLDMWHYVRVKIFSERGREKFSKFDIPFTKGTKIKDLTARVIKKDGTIVDVSEKDIFDREIVRASGIKVKAKSFAVPNIEPGVIVEYRYKEAIDDAGASGMRLPLQRDIPIRHLAYYYKPNAKEPQYQAYNAKEFKFVPDKKGFFLGESRNIPSFKEEPRMPPEDQVRPWLLLTSTRLQFTSFRPDGGFSFVIKDPSNVQAYWGAFAGERGQTLAFVLKPDKKIKAAAETITAGAATSDEKLRRLYDFCQKEIQNVFYDKSLTDEQRKKLPQLKSMGDILERKQAVSPAHVDWLFAALANSLGFDVRLAYTGNRSQMFFNPKMANERLLHFAGIAVGENKAYKYFNPCDPHVPYGMLPWFEEDSFVLMIAKDNYLWAETPALTYEQNNYKRTGNFKLLEDGTLEGDVKIELTGQPAISFRQSYYDDTAEKQRESISDSVKARISGAEVTDVSVENMNEAGKPLVQGYKVRIPNYAQKTGKRLFFQPSFFQYGPSAMFSSSTRQYDIFFRYPWSENDTINISLPPGFSLDNAETPAPFSDTNKIGSIDIKIGINSAKNILVATRNFYWGAGGNIFFAAKTYQPIKNVFDTFHKTDAHTITLRQN